MQTFIMIALGCLAIFFVAFFILQTIANHINKKLQPCCQITWEPLIITIGITGIYLVWLLSKV